MFVSKIYRAGARTVEAYWSRAVIGTLRKGIHLASINRYWCGQPQCDLRSIDLKRRNCILSRIPVGDD